MIKPKTRAALPGPGKCAEDSARYSRFQLRLVGSVVLSGFLKSGHAHPRPAQRLCMDEIIVHPTVCAMLQLRGRAIAPLSKKEKSRGRGPLRNQHWVAET
jgi:hypothetical protein